MTKLRLFLSAMAVFGFLVLKEPTQSLAAEPANSPPALEIVGQISSYMYDNKSTTVLLDNSTGSGVLNNLPKTCLVDTAPLKPIGLYNSWVRASFQKDHAKIDTKNNCTEVHLDDSTTITPATAPTDNRKN